MVKGSKILARTLVLMMDSSFEKCLSHVCSSAYEDPRRSSAAKALEFTSKYKDRLKIFLDS